MNHYMSNTHIITNINGDKINKRGFTLVELLAVIVILAIILAITVPNISTIINKVTKESFKSDAKMVLKAIEYKKLENDAFDPLTITKENMQVNIGLSGENYTQAVFSIVDNNVKVVLVGTGKWNGLTAYGTFKNMKVVNSADYDEVPPIITVLGENPLTIGVGEIYTDAGATAMDLKDGNLTANIITTGDVNSSIVGTYTITYMVSDSVENETIMTRTVKVIKEGNAPVLAAGMTPIKWDEGVWVTTTETDPNWYKYTTADKQWANARTADGSMWVWIPRYIYKISSGWHTNTTGTIDVKFSMGTDDTREGTVTLDTGTTSNASNNKWTNHPAFTFGTTEITGIWVAKFEASNDGSNNVKIIPNAISWMTINVNDIFNKVRNMETTSIYGWGTTGNNIDTHMMKNVEWGAAAYLAKSTYGKTDEIWINPANTYTTGCAGDSVLQTSTTGCLRAYDTTNGMKASTTGTIYGIYDMSGGAWEHVAAYVNNGDANLTTYGNSLYTAAVKYKDAYAPGATDSDVQNYAFTLNKKGDAIYETSNSYTAETSWYEDDSHIPYTSHPWLIRGGNFSRVMNAGTFEFFDSTGSAQPNTGFRSVLLAGEGL